MVLIEQLFGLLIRLSIVVTASTSTEPHRVLLPLLSNLNGSMALREEQRRMHTLVTVAVSKSCRRAPGVSPHERDQVWCRRAQPVACSRRGWRRDESPRAVVQAPGSGLVTTTIVLVVPGALVDVSGGFR